MEGKEPSDVILDLAGPSQLLLLHPPSSEGSLLFPVAFFGPILPIYSSSLPGRKRQPWLPTMLPNPPATCLNINLSDSREQRRHTAPYIYPMGLSPPTYQRSSQRSVVSQMKVPKDYEVWSLFNFVFLNCCCLGFLALLYSVKSRDRKIIGDIENAYHYGRKAKSLNTAALIMSTFFIIFTMTVLGALLATRFKPLGQLLGQQLPPKVPVRSTANSTHN